MTKLFRILFKLFLITALLFGLSVGTLKLLERRPELLREGVEKYFSEATGLSTRIEQTNWIKFYPDLDLSLSKLSFYSVSDPDFFPMTIEKIELKMPFTSVLFNSRNFKMFLIEDLKAKPDIIFPKETEIHVATVYDDGVLPPEIRVNGVYDGAELDVNVGLEREKTNPGGNLYKVGEETLFTMRIGTISMSGTYTGDHRNPVFRGALLQIGKDVYGPQDLDISENEDYTPLTSCLFEQGANEVLVKKHCTGYFNDKTNDE